MEFLNGLEAQLLELRAGNVCQQAGGSCSLYKLLLACSFLSPVLAECKLLRQKAQERHWPVAVCFLFFCVCGFLGGGCGDFQKGVFVRSQSSAARVKRG